MDKALRAWFTGFVTARARPRKNAARGVVWQTRSREPELIAALSGLLTSVGAKHFCDGEKIRVSSRESLAAITAELIDFALLPAADAEAWREWSK